MSTFEQRHRQVFILGLALASSGCNGLDGNSIQEVKFDLGTNIVETARRSGVPKFEAVETAGLITYSVMPVPPEITVRFSQPGFEISWNPVFAATLVADRERSKDLVVQAVNLALAEKFWKHDAAQKFVESTLAQFRKGKWKRFIRAVCPRTTGRSTLLDEKGELDPAASCALDPDYRLSADEWRLMMTRPQRYEWSGDGVLAMLEVSCHEGGNRGPEYRVELEFELEEVQKQRLAAAQAADIEEGEKKGWGTAAEYAKYQKETAERNRVLEAAALKRGDSVVPADTKRQ